MKEFLSLGALAEHLVSSEIVEMPSIRSGLKRCVEAIQATAEAEIGNYQDAIGPYPAWVALAESTENEKERLGYPPDAPLLREGDLRDSFRHEVEKYEATVGSIDPVMEYHEFGTSKMPPRPVVGPALVHNLTLVQKLIGNAAVTVFVGGDALKPGPDFTLTGSGD